MSKVWDGMSLDQRVRSVHLDVMKHQEFALLASVVCVGELIYDKPGIPTAATNGRDAYYNTAFCTKQNKKQLRYIVLHENFHKMLRHCTLWAEAFKKDGQRANRAADFVVNGLIEQCDPKFEFVERPAGVTVLRDTKYDDWSFPKVFNDQAASQQQGGSSGMGGKGGKGNSGEGDFDQHIPSEEELTPDEEQSLRKQIEDAIQQGQLLVSSLRSTSGTGGALLNKAVERNTDYREQLREFIESSMEGYDDENWSSPDRHLWGALEIVMPTYTKETMGHLVVAADTSGSMAGYYPILFGEVAQIVKNVCPERVTLLWWDTAVAGVQEFTMENYDDIAKALKPAGGGGTTPEVVNRWLKDNKCTPQAVVFLTDGYIGAEPHVGFPTLWGVIDNDSWFSKFGKTLHIPSGLRY